MDTTYTLTYTHSYSPKVAHTNRKIKRSAITYSNTHANKQGARNYRQECTEAHNGKMSNKQSLSFINKMTAEKMPSKTTHTQNLTSMHSVHKF